MPSTVTAEGNGLFHKGSGGKGVAPGDVCLTPPPPPAGPIPVPYVNMLSASDLSSGSSTVKIEGEPTALEDQSEISTSSGNEPATQGGNVITHKTKGKGGFKSWSHTVKVEGKGACRHSDMLGQNCGSTPVGIIDPSAMVNFLLALDEGNRGKPCTKPYPGNIGTNDAQKKACFAKVCWSCPATLVGGSRKVQQQFTPDHQPPQQSAWEMGGCHEPEKFDKWRRSVESCKPQCAACSNSQGGTMGHLKGSSVLEYLSMAWPH